MRNGYRKLKTEKIETDKLTENINVNRSYQNYDIDIINRTDNLKELQLLERRGLMNDNVAQDKLLLAQ
jgi:hypothetical protein